MNSSIQYQFEYETRLRCCFIGAGGHSYRNIYPSLQYTPVDLLAICDLDGARASSYARLFGARAHYTDHQEMLSEVRPDAVFIVTGYNTDGTPQATQLAIDCLEAGCHVWMEKPTASSVAAVRALQETAELHHRFVMTGLKKAFTPAMEKVKAIMSSTEFGTPSCITIRYPQSLPPFGARDGATMRGFLDHIYHPGAVLLNLMGPIERMYYEWTGQGGATVTSLKFRSGAVGSLHLAAGSAPGAPLERVEVTGEGAHVVLDNGLDLTYYRRGAELVYGRSGSSIVDDSVAPLHWRPEFSLGQLYNKNIFYLGYVPELLHFCDSVLQGTPPQVGTLEESRDIAQLFEAYVATPPGAAVELSSLTWKERCSSEIPSSPAKDE